MTYRDRYASMTNRGLEVQRLRIPEVMMLKPVRHQDQRGFSTETYNKRAISKAGIDIEFVQDLQTFSKKAGTIRGLHFQAPPSTQNKLIRVLQGRIFDVAVDIRRSSPTFGQHVAVELSADKCEQIFIPEGFAHGLCTLEPNTLVLYKLSNYYAPDRDHGIRWNDPKIGISWPLQEASELSARDQQHPLLEDLPPIFE